MRWSSDGELLGLAIALLLIPGSGYHGRSGPAVARPWRSSGAVTTHMVTDAVGGRRGQLKPGLRGRCAPGAHGCVRARRQR